MPHTPTIFVIFGATGDLVRRKIVPALWHLFTEEKLHPAFTIIGFSRRDLTQDAFREYIGAMLRDYRKGEVLRDDSRFLDLFTYVRGLFDTKEAYIRLQSAIEAIERRYGTCANKHYLAKEMIQNILAFRFSNNLFEKNWSSETIERIDIRVRERLGVEERGGFYDGVGALRDVGQNHLLQMLALITMERPESFDASALRRRRAEILQTLVVPASLENSSLTGPARAEILSAGMRAQYDGYRAIRGVAPDSQTETYFRINAALAAPRWKGVPVMLESGKRLGVERKEIVITFRHPLPCLCPSGAAEHFKNRIVISLEPEEKIAIHFWSKKPGFAYALEERTLAFMFREAVWKSQYVEEYKKLLLDCITGDQTLFVSTEEVKAMWRFIDPVSDAWREGASPLLTYGLLARQFHSYPACR